MKTVLIVYAISSIVVISIYIAIYISSKVQKETVDYSPRKLVLNFVFSPFVLLYIIFGVVPFTIISDIKHKIHKVIPKLKKRIAIYKYNLAVSVNKFTITPEFIEIAEELQRLAIHNEHLGYFEGCYKCTEMIVCLNKLSLPNLSFLCVRRCKNVGNGDRSYLYVSKDGSNDYSIWSHITVEDSHMGAWQVYLLNSIWHSLPLFWHGLYDKRSYIYSEKDIARIKFIKNEVPKSAMSIREFNIIPEVVNRGTKYYISCCYWNNWTGLNREVVEITIKNNMVKNIAVIETYNLIKYHCGVLY